MLYRQEPEDPSLAFPNFYERDERDEPINTEPPLGILGLAELEYVNRQIHRQILGSLGLSIWF
ncbi:hypothetical protein GFS31_00030 [Leptolyngbya sp. BL0902]|uniref:hypothetical protein n=1 Tax=Leptolyngbya sp. BL0902 TaxID=1115757 RepID=UPI0018E7F961|nr:hypothetical protein [Leptolyngbya sp. BL0902]QQE63339.1 hypothetical protein GFS31_00030 [Leptolyngbya sp. BL0902]